MSTAAGEKAVVPGEAGPRPGEGLARQTAAAMFIWAGAYLSKAVGSLVIAKTLSVEEFGAYGVLNALIWVLTPVVGLSLWTYLNRQGPGTGREARLRAFQVTLTGEVGLSLLCVVLLVHTRALGVLLQGLRLQPYRGAVVAALYLVVVTNLNTEVVNYVAAKLEIIRSNLCAQLAQALPALAIVGLWLLQAPLSVARVLWLTVGGSLAATLYGCTRIEWKSLLRLRMERRVWLQAGWYSAPLVFTNLNYGLLRFFDRFVLATSRDLRAVGIYTFAYLLVSLLYTFAWRVFVNSFNAHIVAAHNQGALPMRNMCLTYLLKLGVGLFVGFTAVFLCIGRWVVTLIGRPEYTASVPWVAWIALSHLLIIGSVPGDLLLQLSHRTRLIATIEIAAAVSTIALDFLLIPHWGIAGAVVASCVGWSVVLGGKSWAARSWRVISRADLLSLRREREYGRNFLRRLRPL